MQTFLPYKNFSKTAKVLDDKRLFKQLVEARQLINLITTGKTKSGRKYRGFINHPAKLMWSCCPNALKEYANAMLFEVRKRGKTNTSMRFLKIKSKTTYPKWMGSRKFHSSHRSALLAKGPKHYKQFNWVEKPHINYIWPRR